MRQNNKKEFNDGGKQVGMDGIDGEEGSIKTVKFEMRNKQITSKPKAEGEGNEEDFGEYGWYGK